MMGLHFMDEVPFQRRLHPRHRSRREGREDVEVEGQRHRSAGARSTSTAPMRCASRWPPWRRRGATSSSRTARVEGYRNFATKIWNAARFAEMNGCARVGGLRSRPAVKQPLNRWILERSGAAPPTRSRPASRAYRFNEAAGAAYRFVWNQFCDWYLELAKPVLQGEGVDAGEKAETQATVAHVLDLICQLLHPFMPFLTEELWAQKAGVGAARQPMADVDPGLPDAVAGTRRRSRTRRRRPRSAWSSISSPISARSAPR